MKTKIIIGGVCGVLILGGLVWYMASSKPEAASQASMTQATQNTETKSPTTTSLPVQTGGTSATAAGSETSASPYTMTTVAKHNSQTSCWSAVNGKVYDLTSWISQHPGGSQQILSICGKDGSTAFNDQHEGQRRPANELTGFLLGDLTN